MSDDNKPIGWWLKRVDRLIEESFDAVLAAEGATRRHWQLLNAVGDGCTQAEAEVTLEPFSAPAETAALLSELGVYGWVAADGPVIVPTPDGVAARCRMHDAVQAFRARVADGVREDEHRIVLGTLRRMADNLTSTG